MNKQLENLANKARPSDAFKERLWHRLDAELTSAPSAPRRRRMQWAAGLLSVGFLLSGTGTYAYASPSVTPDDALYPVKSSIEWVEEQTRFTPRAEIEFHERMIRRRDAELERLSDKPTARERLEDHRARHQLRHDQLVEMIESGELELPPMPVLPPVGDRPEAQGQTLEERIEASEERRDTLVEELEAYIEAGVTNEAIERLYDVRNTDDARELLERQRARDIRAEVEHIQEMRHAPVPLPRP